MAEVFEHDHELVPVQARQQVAMAQGITQPPRHLPQQGVSGLAPHRIVDHLEIVQVERHDSAKPAGAPPSFENP
jgi:hypothetical protein